MCCSRDILRSAFDSNYHWCCRVFDHVHDSQPCSSFCILEYLVCADELWLDMPCHCKDIHVLPILPIYSLRARASYSLPSLSARPNLQLTDSHTLTRTLVDPPNAGNVLELQMECRYTWKLSREQMMFQGIQEHLYIIRETLAKLNAARQIWRIGI